MKVVIAIDSLKGSLTSIEAGKAIKEGILNIVDAEVIVKPLADGGEGTTEVLVEGLGGETVEVFVMGPQKDKIKAVYGYIAESKTAIIEMAAAAGIMLVGEEKNPMEATTYGVGEMIKDAINRGCRNFIIGIGGSATNDGGIGMLTALGFDFYDNNGNKLGIDANELEKISIIFTENAMPELSECNFKIACDVSNQLCGENGATYIYGPQKGVTEEIKEKLDKDMAHYAKVTKKYLNNDYSEASGAGAAGGLGFAFLSYLHGDLQPGIELVIDTVKLEECIKDADYVITGEGCLDKQTAMGKAPVGVAKLAKKYDKTVIALAGSVTDDAVKCNENGIDAYFPILLKVIPLQEAMKKETARKNMVKTTEQIFRLISAVESKKDNIESR
ncbi:MAG: glycerate kinase [Clostridium sp.]|uniref:glycerate kinase family protein n=1 Tax=Clostridium sp. TaxID=1506 RepID=UPI0025BA1173|nr:glycerate kinase [Clostridium sp.]MBS4956489.1 glycerate kinase [Clostridium sp.]